MEWKVDNVKYFNERLFLPSKPVFRSLLKAVMAAKSCGGIDWFGVDDTFYTVYSPMYCGITEVPHSYAVVTEI